MGLIVKFNKTAEKIWNNLMEKLDNPTGVAALMGAMYAVSGLKTNLVNTNGGEKFNRPNDYTYSVNNDEGIMESFVHDGYSYGICQWNWWVSKQGLFNMAKKEKKSIGGLELQLDFLWDELHTNENSSCLNHLTTAKNMDICIVAAYDYIRSHRNDKLAIGTVAYFANQFYDYYFMHNSLDAIEIKYDISKRNEEMKKKDQRVVAMANNVIVRIADNGHAKQIGMLRTDIDYAYVMSNESKTWHCIVFNDKLRWVSAKTTRVIGV